MILPDTEILRRHADVGDLVIRPFERRLVQPASYDVRLGRVLKIAQYLGHRVHDLIDDGPYHLSQGTLALGATLEWVEVPADLAGVLAGKSTRARQGLILESAGYVDPGWRGELTLELANLSPRPILLTHGMRIGQLRFEQLTAPAARPYGVEGLGSHYQGSLGPVEATP